MVTSLPHSHLLREMLSSKLHSLEVDSSKVLLEVDSSRFLLDIESLNILLADTSFSFLLSSISLDETSSSYSLLDELPLFDVESSDDCSTTKTFLSKDIIGVDSSSHELVNEVARDASRFELMPSYFNN